MVGRFQRKKGGRRFALEGGMPDVLNQNILFLGAGAGFVSKTTHYQLKVENKQNEILLIF